MTEDHWLVDFGRAVGIFLNGNAIPDTDYYGSPVTDDSFLLYLSAHHGSITFPLPLIENGKSWSSSSAPDCPRPNSRRRYSRTVGPTSPTGNLRPDCR